MTDEHTPDDALLDALADDADVDWAGELESARGDTRARVRAMGALARIRALAREALPDEARPDAPLPATWGTLELVARLGEGGFGTVFRARDPDLGLEVALKVLRASRRGSGEQLLEEGRRLARLRHPNIVRVYGVDRDGETIGLRMELVEGRTLHDVVERDGPRTHDEVARIGIEVSRALTAVHAAGLVHRDVKAGNVMLEDGRVVLMDLGAGEDLRGSASARARPAIGTPRYLAPELWRGEAATPASDLFALGVLLHYLLTGDHPEGAPTPGPPRLARTIDRLLATDPSARPARAAEVARALRRALATPTPLAHDETPIPRGTPADEVPAPTTESVTSSLPVPLTPLFGRARELEEIARHLEGARLVTLVGVGGAGKTRLAIAAAAHRERTHGAATFVELTALTDGARVGEMIGVALGVRQTPHQGVLEVIARHLGETTSALIVLDNAEHLVAGVAEVVSSLLRQVPGIRFLVTSREPLRVEGEHAYFVEPLPLPDPAQGIDQLGNADAVTLFIAHARAARSSFDPGDDAVRAIADICARLDGIPLAIELAAARVRALSPAEIARRLDQRFRLLDRGARDAPLHHATLEASVRWSYELCTPVERRVFCALSVFRGGWTLAAAEAVLPGAIDIAEHEVIDVLSALVARSLVRLDVDDASGDARYDMLETLRAFAALRLEDDATDVPASGSPSGDAGRAHLDYFVELAATLGNETKGPAARPAMAKLAAEAANLTCAFEHALAENDPRAALRLVIGQGKFWQRTARWSYGYETSRRALAHAGGPETHPAEFASAASWCAVCGNRLRMPDAMDWSEQALSLYRKLDDHPSMAAELNVIGVNAFDRGDTDLAIRYGEESLELRRTIGDASGIAQTLNNLGVFLTRRGDLAAARACYEEAMAIAVSRGDSWYEALVLNGLGVISVKEESYARAKDEFLRALEINRAHGADWHVAGKLTNLGWIAVWEGRHDDARTLFDEAFAIFGRVGDRVEGHAGVITGYMALLVAERAFERAAELHGAILAHFERLGPPYSDHADPEFLKVVAALEANLSTDALERARAKGRMSGVDGVLTGG